ncbi:MAG: FAD-binding oxidoreductase [Phycisphaerales bacterium]|nr:FAD-binding oxidoreductase [Phycisphaerales bacterium]
MTKSAIVVGAGIVGASTAWHLAQRGYQVTLLERDAVDAVADSASGGNAGLLSIGHFPLTRPGASWRGLRWMFSQTAPLYIRPRFDRELISWLWNFHLHCTQRHLDRSMAVLGEMGFKSLAVLELMMAEAHIECDYKRDGWLDVVLKPENLAVAEAEARSLEQYGYKWERLEKEQLLARDACFTPEVSGAIHMKDSAHCAPHLLIAGIVRALPQRGVSVLGRSEVRALKLARSGRVTGVQLVSGEEFHADVVVLTAGIWSDAIAKLADVSIPMQAARGYHLQFAYPSTDAPALPSTGMVLHESFVAVTPMQTATGQELRIAGTLEIGPVGAPWMHERVAMLLKGGNAYLKGLDALKPIREWAGYRPCTSDGLPAVGGLKKRPGLFVATGHAMMGMTLGPVTGKALAEMIDDEAPCFDCRMLDPERFS